MTVEELLLILLLSSFVPPVIYVSWISRAARYRRVGSGTLAKAFLFGAIIGVIVAVILSLLLIYLYSANRARIYGVLGFTDSLPEIIILGCVIAPLAEELAKLLGVKVMRSDLKQHGDGFVVGAACGLGFAATENMLYGYIAYLEGGLGSLIVVAVLRSVSSALLHGSATAISGHGYALHALHGQTVWLVLNYFVAVVMHGFFNFMASLGVLYEAQYGVWPFVLGLLVVLAMAWGATRYVRIQVAEADIAHAYEQQRRKKAG